jgi:hypothetical protein
VTDPTISHFNVNLLNFTLGPKIPEHLETTDIQFTSGYISIICSPISQIFITIPFVYGSSKRLLSKRFHHISTLCICFFQILNYIINLSQYVRSNCSNTNIEQKHDVRFAAPVAVTVEVTGSEVFERSPKKHFLL